MSSTSPSPALRITAKGKPIQSGRASEAGPTNSSAAMAPKVTISPWAKFEMPVVPNTSERPTAASASIRPKLMPSTIRCTNWSKKLVTLRWPSPMKKLTDHAAPGSDRRLP